MLFAELVATSEAVGSTRSRNAKIDALAALIAKLGSDEIVAALSFLVGAPRQGRIGVGWATSAITGSADEATVPIADIDTALGELAGISGTGSKAARREVIDALGSRLTPPEAAFVRQLLTGEVRHGALAGVVTDAVAKASGVSRDTMRRAAMLSGDLAAAGRVALIDGADATAAIGLNVGTAIQPMLASTAADVSEALDGTGMASVEWKLDGIRIQAHRDGDEVRLFTRNLNDITGQLPQVVDLMRSLPVRSIVLDGEMVGTERVPPGGTLHQDSLLIRSHRGASPRDLLIGFFDILHLDGVDLIDLPLSTRHDTMTAIDGLPVIPSTRTDDADVAARVLDDALAHGHEGVMVKELSSVYAAGRRGATWRKIKPVHTLDLVVLAVEWGSGRRRGLLSNLHLGALDTDGRPVMVGKTFKGLTDELLAWQTARFLELETHRDGHVVYVRPEQVVEIALDAAQVSTRYPGGVTLRFARVRRYRPDKEASDADTLDAVRALLPGANRQVRAEPLRLDWIEALVEGDDVFTERFGIAAVDGWVGFPETLPYALDAARRHREESGGPEADPWGSHLFFDTDGALVGFGGFKGAPVNGEVEIGYAVAPSRQGRGIATAAAGALIERARAAGVEVVLAHTLAEPNASTAVLTRCGFEFDGEAVEDDDMVVWRWRLTTTPAP